MSVSVSNLIQGPATIYRGLFGAVEPIDSALLTVPSSGVWTDLGGTQDGLDFEIAQTYTELDIDQVIEVPESRLTKRVVTAKTNLAEATLQNLAIAMNTTAPTAATGTLALEPDASVSSTQPLYSAFLIDGWAPQGFRRRIILRKVLNKATITGSYKKDDQTLWPVEFSTHYVSSTIKSFRIIDQTA